MNFSLKSNHLLTSILPFVIFVTLCVPGFWWLVGTVWTRTDFQVLDVFYRYAVNEGYNPPPSRQIVYLGITNESYTYFGKNVLDRRDLADMNRILKRFAPQSVAYDIIFPRPSEPRADQEFAESIEELGCVYLPVAFDVTQEPQPFQWQKSPSYNVLQERLLKQPVETSSGQPLYGTSALLQWKAFFGKAVNSGHVNAVVDADGVYRHHPMLIKIDSAYAPTLTLSVFLDYVGVPFEEILIDWGNEIRIPATEDSYLDADVVIPIDEHGLAFIPFIEGWGKDFSAMPVHALLEYAQDVNLEGNLIDFFEGKFVFVVDVSQGISDIGSTPLEENAPLVMIHAALLNGMLTRSFYRQWQMTPTLALIFVAGLMIVLSMLPRASWVLYSTGILLVLGLTGFTWHQLLHFTLFPLVTVAGSVLFLFVSSIMTLQVMTSRQQAFIRGAFAKYLPDSVVEELLTHPDKLSLGGEEREISILFSDLQNFTTISEQLSPQELVKLLNEYLSEMTAIILNEGGIIDKYLGDAIMAEFGAPLPVADHADRAVSAALNMQRRLEELQQNWAERNLPELKCRIGIHTGPVIIGNMGSDRVFDYTVIGDTANLASRLEGANKLYNTFLMISESTYHALTPDRFLTRLLDVIAVKGKSKAVKVFEVYGETTDPAMSKEQPYYKTYQAGFEAYLNRNLTLALERFALALQLRPNDPASRWLISRIAALNLDELSSDWDGSVKLTSK